MAMFDILNDTDHSITSTKNLMQFQSFPPQISHSRGSNSLVVNPSEEDSSNKSSPFIFDIMKKGTDATEENNKEDENIAQEQEKEIVPMTLFPVTADRGGRVFGVNKRKTQWLNLSPADEPDGKNEELRSLYQKQSQVKKGRRGPRSRSSQFRGVTFYRRTGRWESHIWDCGKQVYLGGFDTAQAAARAYDRAAIKFRGVEADINFNLSDYEEDLKQMKGLSKEEFVLLLRRQINGISRTNSAYRRLLALHKYGQGEPRMVPFVGMRFCNKPSIKSDDGQVLTNVKPWTYNNGKIIANSSKGGTCHDLDLTLSLGNSSSSNQLKNNDSEGGLPFGYTASSIPNDRESMEKAGTETFALQRSSNLARQLCSNGAIASGRLLSSAASSGFSTNNSTVSSSLPISTHDNATYNLHWLNHNIHHQLPMQ